MARNQELNQKMKDEKVEQILNAGLKLFATKGLAATKIIYIAKEAKISQGLLYHYYKSKEEIFTELIRSAFENMNKAALGLEKLNLSPLDKLKLALNELLKGFDKNEFTSFYHLLIIHANVSEDIPEEAKKILESESKIPYDVIARIIRKGQKDGSFVKGNANEMSILFWTTIKGLAMHKAANGENFKMPKTDTILRMFINN